LDNIDKLLTGTCQSLKIDWSHIINKTVLVTGAGGSIGSAICKRLMQFRPKRIVMLDRDESALHALQLSMTGFALLDSDDIVLADIRDRAALFTTMDRVRPNIVFHAAALKHLPLLERFPAEAAKTNIVGTANVLYAASMCDVDTFVNISTDKAADPECILGASKRVAERMTSWFSTSGQYVSVRFGNVFGSRGSVIDTFRTQIRTGGPVTITDSRVARFFMNISQAVDLVIEASGIGKYGEALVLDMGMPIRILDIAQRMIANRDIQITYTGLRNGEKLIEQLFGKAEISEVTPNPLIRGVSVPVLNPAHAVCRQPWYRSTDTRAISEAIYDMARLGVN
jgi:FlaA1/EpsC-like NDP-sugar epimerase